MKSKHGDRFVITLHLLSGWNHQLALCKAKKETRKQPAASKANTKVSFPGGCLNSDGITDAIDFLSDKRFPSREDN